MKFFIAAILVQGALALMHTFVYTQSKLSPDSGDFSLCGASYHSNLGGEGPDFAAAEELRYFEVMEGVDLVVTTIGDYEPYNISRNGFVDHTDPSCFGQINVGTGTEVELQFNFYETGTTTPVTIEIFYFSWFDIDQGNNNQARETVVFHGVEEVYADENTTLLYTSSGNGHDANYSHAFTSTEQGSYPDNPTDPLNLTEFQRSVTVTAKYVNVAQWTATISVSPKNNGNFGGRNLVFAGRSALVPPAPSPAPTPAPTPSGSSTAIGDPHLTNMRGDRFDLWQFGQVQFFRVPSDASRSDAEFMLDAVVQNSTSDWRSKACLSPYVVEAAISGRSIPEHIFVTVGLPGQVVVSINGSATHFGSTKKQVGKIYGRPLFMGKTTLIQHPHMSPNTNQAVQFLVGDAVIQFSAGKAHLNVFADGMLTFKQRVGGLLGEDDFAAAATPPKQCEAKGGSKHLLRKRMNSIQLGAPPPLRNSAMYSA